MPRIRLFVACIALASTGRATAAAELEAFARALPHVQQASVTVRVDASRPAPYRQRFAP